MIPIKDKYILRDFLKIHLMMIWDRKKLRRIVKKQYNRNVIIWLITDIYIYIYISIYIYILFQAILFSQTVLIQNIQFSISIDFVDT